MNRYAGIIIMAFGLSLVLVGCTEEDSAPQPSPVRKVAGQTVKLMEKQEATVLLEEPPRKYVYDPTGRRDPFQSFLDIKQVMSVDEAPLTPLQKYDLNQFRLIGIIFGKGQPVAMVVAPDGKSYILKKGVKIGKNHGIVTKVAVDVVVVEEKFLDFSGETRINNFEIKLPKREGV